MDKPFCTVYINCLIFERTKYQNVKNFPWVSKEAFLIDYQKPCGLIKLKKQKIISQPALYFFINQLLFVIGRIIIWCTIFQRKDLIKVKLRYIQNKTVI